MRIYYKMCELLRFIFRRMQMEYGIHDEFRVGIVKGYTFTVYSLCMHRKCAESQGFHCKTPLYNFKSHKVYSYAVQARLICTCKYTYIVSGLHVTYT